MKGGESCEKGTKEAYKRNDSSLFSSCYLR